MGWTNLTERMKTNMSEEVTTNNNATFRFRAESTADTAALLDIIPNGSVESFQSLRQAPFPDEFCEIVVSGLDLDSLREFCREVKDGHVMLQTIQPKEDYTGVRDYSIS